MADQPKTEHPEMGYGDVDSRPEIDGAGDESGSGGQPAPPEDGKRARESRADVAGRNAE